MLRALTAGLNFVQLRNLHSSNVFYVAQERIAHCYSVLSVSEDCSSDELRQSYLHLAKQYHPDSGSKTADTNRFTKLKDAYQTIQNYREETEATRKASSEEEDSIVENEIDLTAPQHRHYLTNEGVGFGPPGVRQRQYQQYRLQKATDVTSQYKTDKISAKYETRVVIRERRAVQKIKTRSTIERLVEDLIAESMAKGEFDDLPGKGKPLDYDTRHNPMLDCETNNLNRILIQNGYVPDWITLEKEIRESISASRQQLLETRTELGANHTCHSLNDLPVWRRSVGEFNTALKRVNTSVDSFNLMVPLLWKQMAHFKPERELQRVLETYGEGVRNGTIGGDVEEGDIGEDDKRRPYEPVQENNDNKIGVKSLYRQIKELFISS